MRRRIIMIQQSIIIIVIIMEKWPRSLQLPGAPRGGQWVNKLNMFPGSLELYTEYISGKPMLNIFPGCLGLPGELPDAVHQDVLHAEVAWEAIIIRRRIYIIVVFVMITINAYIYIYIYIYAYVIVIYIYIMAVLHAEVAWERPQ